VGGGEAALGWAGVETKRRGQLDGEVEQRHGNGDGCGSRAREQRLASPFIGEQEEERGLGTSVSGQDGQAGPGTSGAWPDAAVAERGVRGAAGSPRGRRARSSGGDGAAQRAQCSSGGGWSSAGQQQRGSGAAAAGGSTAALLCSRVPGVKEERERRERSKRVDFKFSQNFQLKH